MDIKEKLSKMSMEQLTTLLFASKEHIEIGDLCDYRYSLEQLDLLINMRKEDVDVSALANPLIPIENMEVLADAIVDGYFLKEFANPLLDFDKLELLVESYYAGINVQGLANPFIEYDVLKKLINLRLEGRESVNINITEMSASEVECVLSNNNMNPTTIMFKEKTVTDLDKYINGSGTKIIEKKSNVSRGKIYSIYKKNK